MIWHDDLSKKVMKGVRAWASPDCGQDWDIWTMQIGKEIYCLRAQYTKNMFTSFHCLDLHLGRKLHAFTTAILPPKDSLMDHQCNPAVASTSTDANPSDNTVYMGQLALVPTYELSINQ